MGEEDHTHDDPVNRREEREERQEATASRRLRRVYGDYARSERKRRAWAADNPGNIAIRSELRELALRRSAPQLEGGGRILDLGCGGGWWLRQLIEVGVEPGRLHGVDLLAERVETARAVAAGADIRRADARDLPFDDRSFELAFAFTVLSSLLDRGAVQIALAEASRVLTPGGLLLCYEPRLPNPLNPETRRISLRELRSVLPGEPKVTPLTVLPALARRLGSRTDRLYPPLARLRPLLSHRLIAWTKPGEQPGR
jgi:SAM-dependent methyltransferase